MRRFAKQLQPFATGIILTIALLFVQAFSDLNLPNYMSSIINIGIQQSGIEQAAPEQISPDGMQWITSLMPADEQQYFQSHYESVDATDPPHYIKKEPVDTSDTNQLNDTYSTAALTMLYLVQDIAPSTPDTTPTDVQSANIDVTELYPLLPAVLALPDETVLEARQQAEVREDMQKQTGILFTKSFYEELGIDLAAKQTAYIVKIGLRMMLIALIGGMATVFVGLLAARIATGVGRNMRKQVFEKVTQFSSQELDKFSTASLITRNTNDITQIQQVMMMALRMMFFAPILGVGGIIMAVRKSPSMSWIIAVAVVVVVSLILVIMLITLPKFKWIQKLMDKLNLVSRENLSGLMVVRAFGTQKFEKERFEDTNTALTDANLFVNRVMVFMMPTLMLIMNGVTLLIVWVGAHRIADSTLQVGDMMAFMQYVMQILMSFMMLSMMFIMVPRAAVSIGRVNEVLATEIAITDPKHAKPFDPDQKGVLAFHDVGFRYTGAAEKALHHISFVAKPGQTTAFIGSTGSGKSTIANLSVRFYDVSEGSVSLDGVDIRDVNLKDLRTKIGFVQQNGVLLSGTIASNLRYGNPDASDEEIERVADIAQATEFIETKSEGFESPIAQGGTNVSGGQKQRLTIGRALAKKPDVLIFDDSFSALDVKTDASLRQTLKEQVGDATVIIVAQRVSTIMHADQILVLEKGEVVGRGTHRELLQTCPEYMEIASSQLSKEELA